MPRIPNKAKVAWVVFVLVGWFGSTNHVMAQDDISLVIVTDASDERAFRRVGDGLVEVELLMSKETDWDLNDYQTCNQRVVRLRHFRFLFYRDHGEDTAGRFWRQRLTAANPKGEAHSLSRSLPQPEIEQRAQRAKIAHQTLLVKLPGQREQLDANLKKELHRLFQLTARPLGLASSTP